MPRLSPESELAELERRHLRRVRRTVERLDAQADPAGRIVNGRRLVQFCGNDYLGLAAHPAVTEALRDSAARAGVGAGASHLVTGHGLEHEHLEEALAAFLGRDRALLFSTGYMANLAVLTALATRGDHVLLDRFSHASLIDGALLSGARVRRYTHADAMAADRLLTSAPAGTTLIATDGVFSMDGDLAPLADLARLAAARDAWLVVDDAHGLGVVGPSGRGALELAGLGQAEVPVLVGTLGKAFGTFGAFVAGSAELIDYLVQRARPYIYTTALPQCVAAAARTALELAQLETWRRERLHALVARFRAGAEALGVPLTASQTPIQPVILGQPASALAASAALEAAGFWVSAIRPPTVPAGSSRLRITLSALHTDSQVDALVEALGRACTAITRKGLA